MPKPICIPCHRFFRPKQNGFYLTEGMPVSENGEIVRPGLEEAHKWKPYKVWAGDLYQCEGCQAEIVVGFGHTHITEHYLPNFKDVQKGLGADKYQVNDC